VEEYAMSEPKLKLVKSKKVNSNRPRKATNKRVKPPVLSLAEEQEAARFKALISARVAQRFMVREILQALEATDDISSAA
jgi:hypothetical protein